MTTTQVHISAHQRPQPAERLVEVLGQFVSELKRSLFDHYRPERYYMRGPGPKWRERYGKAAARATDGFARRQKRMAGIHTGIGHSEIAAL